MTNQDRETMPSGAQFPSMPDAAASGAAPVQVQNAGSQNVPPGSAAVATSAATGSSVAVSAAASADTISIISTNQQLQQQQPGLSIEDSLSFLTTLKVKMKNNTQVYEEFLDIMREMKTQNMCNPSMIQGVSRLFKGDPELIAGFNIFLPPGYKIEFQDGEQTRSSGTNSPPVSATIPPAPRLQGNEPSSRLRGSLAASDRRRRSHPPALHPPKNTRNSSMPNNHHTNSHHRVPSQHAVSQAIQELTQSETGGPLAPAASQIPIGELSQEHKSIVEYVNKIKERFGDHPEVYNQFLEILDSYRNEQNNLRQGITPNGKQLTEAQVYSQVAKLFENQDDLLAEFRQYLPDLTSPHNSPVHDSSNPYYITPGIKKFGIRAPPRNILGSERASSNNVTNRNTSSNSADCTGLVAGGPERTASAAGNSSSNDRERRLGMDRDRGSSGNDRLTAERKSSGRAHDHAASGSKMGRFKRSSPSSSVSAPPAKKNRLASSVGDVTLSEASKYASKNDLYFFDKVNKSLKNRQAYDDFLRCLQLFNNKLISKSELVLLITPHLSKFPDLFKWFKNFLEEFESTTTTVSSGNTNMNNSGIPTTGGARRRSISATGNDVSNSAETVPNNIPTRYREHGAKIDLSSSKKIGFSYRALPSSYSHAVCSGTTLLCRQVLNNTWVSFPTWSDESAFVSSRKTNFEEFIYQCEDERFEVDIVLETNTAAIIALELVKKKMRHMTPEKLSNFQLDDCLGGTSATIQQVAIKRIYGDKASDIIEGLKKNPTVAVPLVLKRLKAKEVEWRNAQKQFNKKWHETDEKYYLKSLDRQGSNFKLSDVKIFRSKRLLNEIESLFDKRLEQQAAAEGSGEEIDHRPHLSFSFPERHIVEDAANLLIHHVKRQTALQRKDKQRIKKFLLHFLPDLFFYPRQELSEDERDDYDDNKSENSISTNINQKEDNESDPIEISFESDEEWYRLFIGNNHLYLFLRLHNILCERLSKMYDRAMAIADEEAKYRKVRKESVAVALRLKSKSDIEIEDYYPAFLDMVKSVLDCNLDSAAYEDKLREMLGIHAYIAFTLDKVVISAVRQLQHIATDAACIECIDLFVEELKKPTHLSGVGGPVSNARSRRAEELAYQKKAEQILHLENSFKIVVYKNQCKLTTELLDTENEEQDTTLDTSRKSGNGNSGGAGNSKATPRRGSRDRGGGGDASNEEPDELDSTQVSRRKLMFGLRKRNTNSSGPNLASNSPSASHMISPHGGDSSPCLIPDQESNSVNNESGEDKKQRRKNRFKKDPYEGLFEEDDKKESDRYYSKKVPETRDRPLRGENKTNKYMNYKQVYSNKEKNIKKDRPHHRERNTTDHERNSGSRHPDRKLRHHERNTRAKYEMDKLIKGLSRSRRRLYPNNE